MAPPILAVAPNHSKPDTARNSRDLNLTGENVAKNQRPRLPCGLPGGMLDWSASACADEPATKQRSFAWNLTAASGGAREAAESRGGMTMKWTGLASGLVVALAATLVRAESPEWSNNNAALAPVISRGQQFSRENWWTRFGEPVNATALAEVSTTKAGGGDVGGPLPLYGDGYIYGPGSCDCPPPCIYHLWSGYQQHPKRCDPYVPFFQKHFGNGDCCSNGSCGLGGGCGCGKACGPSCATRAACGCGAPVGCGCAAPVAPSAKQASITPPRPLPEDAALIKLPRIN